MCSKDDARILKGPLTLVLSFDTRHFFFLKLKIYRHFFDQIVKAKQYKMY